MKKLLFSLLLATGAVHAQDADQAITDAKTKIAVKMKDPESARFADIVVNRDGKTPLVCGWVNAKNSYGGYVGYRPFYVIGTLAEVRDDASAGSFNNHITFDGIWGDCRPGTVESFGSELVRLPKINTPKYCARLAKAVREPLGYDCQKLEGEAKAWLETHGTTPLIAGRCSASIRQSDSYGSGRRCVEEAEAEIVYDRGPRSIAPTP